MGKMSLKVVVAGRTYPLTVHDHEEARVIKAAEDINKAIQLLQENYAVKDMQDLLAMTALQLASKAPAGAGQVEIQQEPADYSTIERQLDALNRELDDLI
jgi:cell division protein ZapA (FtsZ GTPase activity inhibitor)